MINKLKLLLNFIMNMGMKYVAFRSFYTIITKLGLLKIIFPKKPKFKYFLSLEEWKRLNIPFFFESAESLKNRKQFNLSQNELEILKKKVEKIKSGFFTYFNSIEFNIGVDYDCLTNPDNEYKYDINKHWSEIEDFSINKGDIKYVWEKSRFTFLYDLIRYDYYSGDSQAKFVFDQIESFIDTNPLNQGPNYKCSQEISLRILNWTFALFYYKNTVYLTNKTFLKIINSIYWQLDHVYKNIYFSRYAVRNNHAITETAVLYLSGLLYPFFKEEEWHTKAKKWFINEINYQIYPDGSYLQFSHNYHRVVIQILTWVIKLSKINNVHLNNIKYDRLIKSIHFLFDHQIEENGWLPNYGNNDGSLFFPLNSNHYRDFRPQLYAFASLFNIKLYDNYFEDVFWLDIHYPKQQIVLKRNTILFYKNGGFYGFRDKDSMTTIRCGTYKDRPSQADALNLDIWFKGENILFDPGTYKYNTEKKYIEFFFGTKGHNSLTINDENQMLKGNRFIWFFWTKTLDAKIDENQENFIFEGSISGFNHISKDIIHKRKVIKYKNKPIWIVEDWVSGKNIKYIKTHWNVKEVMSNFIFFNTFDIKGESLKPQKVIGWYSELYGIKQEFEQLIFKSENNYLKTVIEVRE